MRISVIIVSYNTLALLRRCLERTLATAPAGTEVIVVDNASADGSPDMVASEFPTVRLIRNDTNRGFGAANNQGLDLMSGGLALLLNSDAAPLEGAIDRLTQVMADPGVVACGGRLVDPGTDRTQNSCAGRLTLWAVFCEQTFLEKLAPGSRLLAPYWETRRALDRSPSEPTDVEQVQGACLLFRPVERFDERFFLYVEDTDLCRRLRRHGRILYVPSAIFEHELGGSSTGDRWRSVARYNRGKELYFAIHHGWAAAACCLLLNRLGAILRLVGWGILVVTGRSGAAQKAALFCRVLLSPLDPR